MEGRVLYWQWVVGSLGAAVALTAFTVLSLRTEDNKALQGFSLVLFSTVGILLCMFLKPPTAAALILGVLGFLAGFLGYIILGVIRSWERRSGNVRGRRGT